MDTIIKLNDKMYNRFENHDNDLKIIRSRANSNYEQLSNKHINNIANSIIDDIYYYDLCINRFESLGTDSKKITIKKPDRSEIKDKIGLLVDDFSFSRDRNLAAFIINENAIINNSINNGEINVTYLINRLRENNNEYIFSVAVDESENIHFLENTLFERILSLIDINDKSINEKICNSIKRIIKVELSKLKSSRDNYFINEVNNSIDELTQELLQYFISLMFNNTNEEEHLLVKSLKKEL